MKSQKCLLIFRLSIISVILILIILIFVKRDIDNHFYEELNNDIINKNGLSHSDKIKFYGYRFEEHKVKTEDGYILTVWRINGRTNESEEEISKKYKRSVLLLHGLLDSSFTYLAMSDRESLPFILAKNGYDVWMGNNRGTLFSFEHEVFDSNDMSSDYWNFTFHEMAKYDIKALINYVKKTSNREKISYVCHSQGCFQFLIGYTLDPKFFENNIDKYGTMGNVLKISQINKIFPRYIHYIGLFEWLEYFGIRNIMSFSHENVKYFGYLCHRFLWICKTVIGSIIQNESTDKIDWEMIRHVYYFQPGGTSAKNLIHWLQTINSPNLRMFDYGKDNLKFYNQEIPPEYDFTKLYNFTIDIFITTTDGDPYCLKDDFEHMMEVFKKCKITIKELTKYNHLDYLWSHSAHLDIYKDLVNFLNDIK